MGWPVAHESVDMTTLLLSLPVSIFLAKRQLKGEALLPAVQHSKTMLQAFRAAPNARKARSVSVDIACRGNSIASTTALGLRNS